MALQVVSVSGEPLLEIEQAQAEWQLGIIVELLPPVLYGQHWTLQSGEFQWKDDVVLSDSLPMVSISDARKRHSQRYVADPNGNYRPKEPCMIARHSPSHGP